MLRDADVCKSLEPILRRLSCTVVWGVSAFPKKAGAVFGLPLQVFDLWLAADETEAQTKALEATETELAAKVRLLEDHERGLFDEKSHVENQIVLLTFDKERCPPCESVDKWVTTDAKVEFENVKETMHDLEVRV